MIGKCVNVSKMNNSLTIGKFYKIIKARNGGFTSAINNNNEKEDFYSYRFEIINTKWTKVLYE